MSRNIHIVVKYFYPVAAGIETNILETYKVLVNKGWDVTVHTSNLEYTTGEILPEKEIVKGIKVIRYPIAFPSFKPKVPFAEADIICLHNFDILPHFFLLVTALFHKITGKKTYAVVVTPHGGFNPEWRVFSKIESIVKYIYHYTVGVLLINTVTDAVRAVSDWEKEEMIKKGVSKNVLSVISNGIEDHAFDDVDSKASEEIKTKVAEFGNYIIQIGRIYPIKNYETTIKALAKMENQVKFVIVGQYRTKIILNL
jgi:glycosyltransferase involved in cell wall biosynthesis